MSNSLDRLQEALSGAVGAAISTSALYPLEISKTIMQSRTGKDASADTTLTILAKLLSQSGPAAVYKGWPAKTVQSVVQAFGYFYFYAMAKQVIAMRRGSAGGHLTTVENLIAGYLAGVCNIGMSIPLEVVATRLQVSKTRTSLPQIVREVHAESGLQGFFKGFHASLVLCVNPAITNTVFEQLRLRLLEYVNKKTLTSSQAFLLGVIAKIVATLATYPLTRAKTIIQSGVLKAKPRHAQSTSQQMSTTEVLQHIVATEGLPGLFKGIQSQLVRTVLASALMLTVKERVAKRTAVILSILVFVMDNPQFVYGMVKKRVFKMFA